jgi:hypothetical protein
MFRIATGTSELFEGETRNPFLPFTMASSIPEPEYPMAGKPSAYVVHWTDYSPGRGSPLDRDVKLAPDENTATKIANALVEENIKKGWEKVN